MSFPSDKTSKGAPKKIEALHCLQEKYPENYSAKHGILYRSPFMVAWHEVISAGVLENEGVIP